MKISPRLRTGVALLGATLALLAAAPASATPNAPTGAVTANWVNTGAGYSGVIQIDPDPNLEDAVAQNFRVEGGSSVPAFCIDAPQSFLDDTALTYTASTWASTGKPNLGRAAYLGANAASIGTPLADANAEAAATQLAIWSLTDAADLTSVANATIVARANELLANTTALTEKASSYTLDVTTATVGTDVRIDVTFRTNTNTQVANQSVSLGLPGGATTTVTTDPAGNASHTIAAPAVAAPVTATWNGVLPAGSVLATPGGQELVTTADAPIVRSATATVPAQVPTTTTTTPVTTTTPATPTTVTPSTAPPSPTTTAAPAPSELPHTGAPFGAAAALAAAALTGLGLYARRRARLG